VQAATSVLDPDLHGSARRIPHGSAVQIPFRMDPQCGFRLDPQLGFRIDLAVLDTDLYWECIRIQEHKN
jgi:hypothetical protein